MQIQKIETSIYEVRGQKVMLDFDLSEMYQVENRALKQAVKRNIERFPKDFMFQLAKKEWQEVITNYDNLSEFKDTYVFIYTYLCFSNFNQLAWQHSS